MKGSCVYFLFCSLFTSSYHSLDLHLSQQVKVKQIYSKWKADHSAFLWKLLKKPGMGHFLWPTAQPVSPYPSTSSGQFCKGFSQHQQTSCLLSSLSTPWEEVLALNTANREMLPPFPPSFLPLIPPRFCDSSLTFSGSPKLAYRTWDTPSQLAAPAPKSPVSQTLCWMKPLFQALLPEKATRRKSRVG